MTLKRFLAEAVNLWLCIVHMLPGLIVIVASFYRYEMGVVPSWWEIVAYVLWAWLSVLAACKGVVDYTVFVTWED